MFEAAAARNLRTVERFLLVPPLSARFGNAAVSVCDISAGGARLRHQAKLGTGDKGVLRLAIDDSPAVDLEAVVVWSQADPVATGQFVSGLRTWAAPEVMNGLLVQLQASRRSNRIEELRAADRFFVTPTLEARFGDCSILLENLSARGARIETPAQLAVGTAAEMSFHVPASDLRVNVPATVVWNRLKAITGAAGRTFRAGLQLSARPEMMRLAIALLSDQNRAALDTQSLQLKLKIMKARARQFAPSFKSLDSSGVPAEQYLLIQGVREELRLNPEEAMHWYRRARIIINDPKTRAAAPLIADHPDALAVWEYLDRSVDPSLVGRAFHLPVQ